MSIHTMPKAELHCHLDGILDPAMVRDIRRSDPTFPIDPADFECAYPVEDIEQFFRWWDFIDPIEGRLAYFFPILERYIEQLKSQHVVYAEVLVASGELPPDPAEAVEAVTQLRERVSRQEEQRIQVEFLVAFGRNKPLERVEQLVPKILALHRAGLIVGVALAGPEEEHPVRRALDLGLNFSINTDDPGVFGCSMHSEYALLAERFGFTEQDFRRVYANTLRSRFQPRLRVVEAAPGSV